MARHKVYLSVTPFKRGVSTGTKVTSGARFSIDEYDIDINADTKEGSDYKGKITITNTDGEVFVKVDCPHYNIKVISEKQEKTEYKCTYTYVC